MNCWNCGQDNTATAINCSYCQGPNDVGAPLVFGRYKVIGYQGHGAFGTVFKCLDPAMNRAVAVKRLEVKSLGGAGLERIQTEIEAIARLNNENIVRIFDVDLRASPPYMVMEFVDGGSLADRIIDNPSTVRDNFNTLFKGMCDGLRAAHAQQIIHRDIKPENILLTKDGVVKLTDFGLAKFITSTSVPMSVVGTAPYMAPEIWRNDEYDERVDIWSLGVVCYFIWTGHHPFVANTIPALWFKILEGKYELASNVNKATPPEIDALIGHMLVEKDHRAASVEVLKNQVVSRKKDDSGPRTINDFQKQIDMIYGYRNLTRSPLILLTHLSTNLAGIIGGLQSLPDDYSRARVNYYLPKSFAWLCAVFSAINYTIEELIWFKFPDKCIYCGGGECVCSPKRDKTEADANEQLLTNVRSEGYKPHKVENRGFRFYQDMFQRIYGKRNKQEGVNQVALRLLLEINEAADALLQLDSLKGFDSIDVMHLEMADVVAWFFALFNVLEGQSGILDLGYDFEKEFFEMFNGKCYKCDLVKCRCSNAGMEIELFNWRHFGGVGVIKHS
jgi:serine/threonine protein kinase